MTARARISWWFSALCAIPWLLIVGVYTEAFVARLVLSRWPRPMFDDPKQFAPAPLDWAINVLELSFVVSIPLLIGLAVWNWRKVRSDWRYSALIGVFAAGLLAIFILSTAYDPGRVWKWFWD
jgi:hypothetical protein